MTRSQPATTIPSVLLALGTALAACMLLILLGSREPGVALTQFFTGPFRSAYAFGNMLDDTSLLVLTGLGATIAFRAGVFNLGGEGQAYLGAIVAAQFALLLGPAAGPAGIPVVIILSATTAAAVSTISGFLKWRWEIDELITTFLISSALLPIIDYAISEPLRDPEGYLLATRAVPFGLRIPHFLPPSNLNAGLVVALLLAGAVVFLFAYTTFGFGLKTTGMNRRFSKYGGIRVGTYTIVPMMLSGAFHGAAGSLQVLGTRYTCVQGATAGLGWNGIAVALIAETEPAAVIPAALVFAYIAAAAEAASMGSDLSIDITAVIQGLVFIFVTAKGIRLRLGARKR